MSFFFFFLFFFLKVLLVLLRSAESLVLVVLPRRRVPRAAAAAEEADVVALPPYDDEAELVAAAPASAAAAPSFEPELESQRVAALEAVDCADGVPAFREPPLSLVSGGGHAKGGKRERVSFFSRSSPSSSFRREKKVEKKGSRLPNDTLGRVGPLPLDDDAEGPSLLVQDRHGFVSGDRRGGDGGGGSEPAAGGGSVAEREGGGDAAPELLLRLAPREEAPPRIGGALQAALALVDRLAEPREPGDGAGRELRRKRGGAEGGRRRGRRHREERRERRVREGGGGAGADPFARGREEARQLGAEEEAAGVGRVGDGPVFVSAVRRESWRERERKVS